MPATTTACLILVVAIDATKLNRGSEGGLPRAGRKDLLMDAGSKVPTGSRDRKRK